MILTNHSLRNKLFRGLGGGVGKHTVMPPNIVYSLQKLFDNDIHLGSVSGDIQNTLFNVQNWAYIHMMGIYGASRPTIYYPYLGELNW